MIIKKMKLKNWKNFQDAEMTFTERVFIVGPNAAGKSNLLDAIRFLRDIAKKGGGFQYAIESRGGMSKIRCLSSEKHADVTMEIRLAENERQPIDWIYRLSFNDDIKTVSESEELLIAARGLKIMPEAVITEEKAWRRKTGGWVLERTPDSQEEDSETVKSTLLEQPSSNKAFRDISNFLRNAEYLHVIPQLIRDADSYYLKKGKEDFYGKNLMQKIANTPEVKRKSSLENIGHVLHVLVPWFQGIELVQDVDGNPHLEISYNLAHRTENLREFQFSDGTLRMLGFMWALSVGEETVLLEEPELHLHAAIIRQLPEMVSILQKKREKARQVIITTHSFDLLSNQGIGADEVFILQAERERTEVKRTDDVKEIRKYLEAGFSMADAVIPNTSPENVEDILQIDGESA